jgi:tetratricopeptide (TPR) repeat protein
LRTRFRLAAIFYLGLAAGAAAAPTPQMVADALSAGNDLYTEQLADTLLADDRLSPVDRAHVLMARGLARAHLGRPAAALNDFSAAMALGSLTRGETVRALFDRGVVLDELGRTEDAIASYDAAIAQAPDFAAALNNRANAYRRLGRLDLAARDYTASLDAGNPQPEYPLTGLAQISVATGNLDAALAFYRQALSVNPHYGAAAHGIAALEGAPHQRPPKPEPSPPEPSPPRPEAPAQTVVASSGGTIQIGAFASMAMARTAWSRIARATAPLLSALSPAITPVDLPDRGRLYRLRTGPVPAGACQRVRAAGFGCFPVTAPP